jgi:hypothetical protein
VSNFKQYIEHNNYPNNGSVIVDSETRTFIAVPVTPMSEYIYISVYIYIYIHGKLSLRTPRRDCLINIDTKASLDKILLSRHNFQWKPGLWGKQIVLLHIIQIQWLLRQKYAPSKFYQETFSSQFSLINRAVESVGANFRTFYMYCIPACKCTWIYVQYEY